MKTSSLFSLNLLDIGKGLLVSVSSAVVAIIYSSLQSGSLSFDWKQIGATALAACVAYLAKNFLTPASLVTPIK